MLRRYEKKKWNDSCDVLGLDIAAQYMPKSVDEKELKIVTFCA